MEAPPRVDGGLKGYEALAILGLTRKEAELYLSLLQLGEASAHTLMRLLNIQQPHLYSLLTNLKKKGFIGWRHGRPKLYYVKNPAHVMEEKIESIMASLDILKNTLKEIYTNSRRYREQPAVEVIREPRNIFKLIKSVISRTSHELCILMSSNYMVRLVDDVVEKAGSGVRVYAITFPDLRHGLVNAFMEGGVRELRSNSLGRFMLVASDCTQTIYIPRSTLSSGERQNYAYFFTGVEMPAFFTHRFYSEWCRSNQIFSQAVRLENKLFSHRMFVYELTRLRSRGDSGIMVRVSGVDTRSGSELTVRGWVEDVFAEDSDTVYFTVRTPEGKRYSVGGYDAVTEDIEAENIVIESITPPRQSSELLDIA